MRGWRNKKNLCKQYLGLLLSAGFRGDAQVWVKCAHPRPQFTPEISATGFGVHLINVFICDCQHGLIMKTKNEDLIMKTKKTPIFFFESPF